MRANEMILLGGVILLGVVVFLSIYYPELKKTRLGKYLLPAVYLILVMMIFVQMGAHSDQVTITAMKQKNSAAEGTEIWLKSISLDDKEVQAKSVCSEGWIEEDEWLKWRAYDQPDYLKSAVFFQEGSQNKFDLVFQSNKWRGIAKIQYSPYYYYLIDCYSPHATADAELMKFSSQKNFFNLRLSKLFLGAVIFTTIFITAGIEHIFLKAVNAKPLSQRKREVWLDYLKVFSSLLIVLIHTVGSIYSNTPTGSSKWISFLILNTLPRCAVPVFIMVSGMLLIGRSYSKEKIWNYVKQAIVMLVVWNSFYIIANQVLWGGGLNTTLDRFLAIPVQRGPSGHLWYSHFIIWMYLFAPVISVFYQAMTNRIRIYFVIITLLLPGIQDVYKYMLDINVADKLPSFQLYMSLSYIGMMFLGRMIYENIDAIRNLRKKSGLLLVLGFGITVLFSVGLSEAAGKSVDSALSETRLFVIIYSLGVVGLFASYRESFENFPNELNKRVAAISINAVGIYFFHNVIIWLIKNIQYKSININAEEDVFVCLAISLCAWILSVIGVLAMSKSRILGYIVSGSNKSQNKKIFTNLSTDISTIGGKKCKTEKLQEKIHYDPSSSKKNVIKSKQGKNNTIEFLRFVLCCIIILHHFRDFGGSAQPAFRGGYLGVDVMFLFAGFFMMSHFTKRAKTDSVNPEKAAVQYLKDRLLRLVPHHIFSWICVAIVMAFLTQEKSIKEILINGVWEFALLKATGLGNNFSVNGVAWYLSAMLLVSYLFYWMLCKERQRRGDNQFFVTIVVPFIFIAIMSWLWSEKKYLNFWIQNAFVFTYGFWRGVAEMGLGCLCCYITETVKPARKPNLLAVTVFEIVGWLLIIRQMWYGNDRKDFFVVPLAAVLLCSSFMSDSYLTRILDNKLSAFLGKISFPMFLNQWIIMKPFKKFLAGKPFWPAAIGLIAILFGFSILSDKFVRKLTALRAKKVQPVATTASADISPAPLQESVLEKADSGSIKKTAPAAQPEAVKTQEKQADKNIVKRKEETSLISKWVGRYKKYQFLLEELVKRDFKKKYKRTVLGMAWSIISPLLTLLVMSLVFTQFFGRKTPHYTIYLFCGNLVFSYFNESTSQGMQSLMGNAGIFTKVNVPKYLFLFSKNVQTLINFGLTLCVFFVFCFLDHITFTWKFVFLIYPIVLLVLFNIGVGLILSALFVFFRDIQYLWSVFTMLLMYMSAIFYTIDSYPQHAQNLFLINPVYLFIRYFRKIVIEATIPTTQFHLLMLADTLFVLIVGGLIYKKNNTKFLYYV